MFGAILRQLIFVLLQVVTWPFTRVFAPGGMYYQYGDTISAQCQGAGFSVQFGTHVAGWFGKRWMQRTSGRKFYPTRLILFAPESGGYRFVFQLLIFGRGISWATRQDRGYSGYSWPGDGLRLV